MTETNESVEERLKQIADMLLKIQNLIHRIEQYVNIVSSPRHQSQDLRHLSNENSGHLLYHRFLTYRSTHPGSSSITAFGNWVRNGMVDQPLQISTPLNRNNRSTTRRTYFRRRRRILGIDKEELQDYVHAEYGDRESDTFCHYEFSIADVLLPFDDSQVQESLRVEQILQQIQEKTPGTKPKSNENYGLFLRNLKNKKKSQWLLNSRTLDFYDIESETEFMYQDKNRHLKVKMLDGALKTVLVDDSKSVGHALDIICEKLGLTNTDEYALFIEEEKDDYPEMDEDSTLHRNHKRISRMVLDMVEEQQNKKVATLKKKAHTDDDTNWLRNSNSLQEAGVSDESLVVIRRRYTYEPNVNLTNPVEIQLAYVQSLESILDGSHHCSIDEAAKFAAYQNQIQHGDYDENKYRTQIEVKDCFPKEYIKNKEALKKCKEEHKLLGNLDELNGKYKYIQLCQNLPTYGVTLFIVKEKVKGKNKLVPRLLGINKESVMKLDEKNKKVLKMWPLTTLHRWAASPNSFTLDFGAYSEGMYSVQTLEGQQISQLIGGYIDIILKKRTKIERTAPTDDESGVIGEFSVGAQRKQIIQNQKFGDNESTIPKYGNIGNMSGCLSPAQQALITDLDNTGKAVVVIMEELDEENPDYEEFDYKSSQPNQMIDKFDIEGALASIANASASVITSSENWEEEKNLTSTRSAMSTILSNLSNLSQHARFLVFKMDKEDPEGNDLLDAARKLADAFKDLTFSLTPDNNATQDDVLSAINKIHTASTSINIRPRNKMTIKPSTEVYVMLSKGVEKATENLSNATKELADSLDDASALKINEACKKAETKAQHLSMCTKILIPYIEDEKSKLQLANTMKLVGKDVNSLANMCVVATDDDDFRNQINAAAKDVSDALKNMLTEINTPTNNKDNDLTTNVTIKVHKPPVKIPTVHVKLPADVQPASYEVAIVHKDAPILEENVYEIILNANEKLLQSLDEPDEVVKQATRLGKATHQIVNGMNEQAYTMADGTEKTKLLSAAKLLTDATAELLAAAKTVKESPESTQGVPNMKIAAVKLRFATNMATNNALKKALVLKLEHAAKKSVAAATQLVSVGKSATPYNPNPVLQQKFNEARQILITHNAKDLIHAVKESEVEPGNAHANMNLVRSSKDFIQVASRMVDSSTAIELCITSEPVGVQLSKARINADKSLGDLQNAIDKMQDGQEDVDEGLTAMKKLINDLDRASLAAISDMLKPNNADKIKVLEEKINASCSQLQDELLEVTENGKGVPEQVGPSVHKMAKVIQNLTDHSIAFAANLSAASEKQTETLDLSRTVVESVSQLFSACKDASGNVHAVEFHQAVDEAADNVVEAVKDFTKFVNSTVGELDSIEFLMSSIETAKHGLMKENEPIHAEKSFVDYQSIMVKNLKAIARDAHDMVGKAQTSPKELSSVSEDLSVKYKDLTGVTKQAVVLSTPENGTKLKAAVAELGGSCKLLIKASGQFQVSSDDAYAKQMLSENAKDVSVKVALVMTNLQKGSVGTQECINGVSYLSGLIGDIDTTVMFAHTGTLDPEDSQKFPAHKDIILGNSQHLVKDTKSLVGAAQQSQEILCESVTEVLKSATRLIDSVKIGASSLGADDKNGQILLLNAVKDVASALSDLINATKNASGKPPEHPDAEALTSSAKHMVKCLTSLLKTVRSVEDETARGSRAIESTVEAIKQASLTVNPDEDCCRKATPEDLIRATKGITVATAKLIAAGHSLKQADIIESVNIGRKNCIEFLDVAQAAACVAPTEEIKSAVIVNVRETAQAYCHVLDHLTVVMKVSTTEEKVKFAVLSKNVASSVGKVVKVAGLLKGDDLVNPEDPNVIAENELLGAASQIEAAARKLANLQPRMRPKEANYDLNFEEQILEAAKSITSAAGALVKAASAAQRELVADGLVFSGETDTYADTQWSQGLISAARLVAEATGSLCEAANATVLGNSSQEKLVASAQAVSSSTAQLLLACRVKADPYSVAQKRLQTAGSKVRNASDKLVKAAQSTLGDTDEVDTVRNGKKVRGQVLGGLVDQIEAKEQVLKKERELKEARRMLEKIQTSRYHHDDEGSPVWEEKTFF